MDVVSVHGNYFKISNELCDELELNQHNDLLFLYTVQIFLKSMNHMQISVALTGKE